MKKDKKSVVENQLSIKKENKKGLKSLYAELKNKEPKFKTVEVIALILIASIISLLLGYRLAFNNNKKNVSADPSLERFIGIYNDVLNNYYEKIDSKTLIDKATSGMLGALDDFSYYIDEEDSLTFNAKINGEYEGMGVEVAEYNKEIIVLSVFENSPAKKAGIKVLDVITKIDDLDLTNLSTSDLSKYVRENDKDSYSIEIKRNEEKLTFNIARDIVTINTVATEIFEKNDKKIGYIYIGIFSGTAYKQFKDALLKMEEEKIDSLIIDVRDNTGGQLNTAVSIISLFYDSSKVVYQIEQQGKTTKYYSTGSTKREYPIVVLQNGNSASASELLSIALKEQCNATIIGENSYGKGTVQELITLSDGTEYKLTTKKWLSPKGTWINGTGVTADINVALNEEYYNNLTNETDNQLQTAIGELAK